MENFKSKLKIVTFVFSVAVFVFAFCIFNHDCCAQANEQPEFILDLNSNTAQLPQIFEPNIDLSGRGTSQAPGQPQELASEEVLDTWQRDIGLGGIYRMQYNLWKIYGLAKDKAAQEKLLSAYDSAIKKVSDSGGIVLLDIYGTPAGLGKALDRKSPFYDFKSFKEMVKSHIRRLSCEKRYSVWYEVWTAPDLDDFFLGRKQDYLNIYRAVAESARELELETRIHIPVGGPSVSWWFQNLDGNTIITPERSLIYELIKFCYHYRLPLDFITWHAYSTDPKAEKEATRYNKTPVALIRDWLSYFRFDRNIPLIVDEWNFDSGANVLPERETKAFIASSFILSRIKNMHDEGLNYQMLFSLQDFNSKEENVVRNTGIFLFEPENQKAKASPKSSYNVFRMLSSLGKNIFLSGKLDDEFIGVIPTKGKDSFTFIIYNYCDPKIAVNFLSRHIARVNEAERKFLLGLIKQDKLEKVIAQEADIAALRATKKVKALLRKARELSIAAERFKTEPRKIKITVKNIKVPYLYQRYDVDDACSFNCQFAPAQEKEIAPADLYQETLTIKPYSVSMIVLKNNPVKQEVAAVGQGEKAAGATEGNVTTDKSAP